MHHKKHFTIYIKVSLQCNKRSSSLSDSSNSLKLVKYVVLGGKLFHKLTIRLRKKSFLLLLQHSLFLYDVFVTAQVWLIFWREKLIATESTMPNRIL